MYLDGIMKIMKKFIGPSFFLCFFLYQYVFYYMEFTKFIQFAEMGDHSYDGRACVPRNENLTIEMMQQASYELTKLAARV